MPNEKEILSRIGLSKNEIDIYLCLLSNGELTFYEISQKTGIHRPHVYDKIEILIGRGLVGEVKKGNKRYLQAADPRKLESYLDEKIENIQNQKKDLEGVLAKLMERNNANREDTQIEVYKGKEGLKGFLKDIIFTRKNISIMGLEEEKYLEEAPIAIKKYFNELTELGLGERAIIKDKPNAFTFDTPTTIYRKLKSNALNPSNIYIYGNKVGIIIWGNPIIVIKIENENMAKTYQEYFEYLWKIATKC
ncbi:MAG: helix-turn-helix domain-containing protein [Candidatus Micrarchaeia archaeon]